MGTLESTPVDGAGEAVIGAVRRCECDSPEVARRTNGVLLCTCGGEVVRPAPTEPHPEPKPAPIRTRAELAASVQHLGRLTRAGIRRWERQLKRTGTRPTCPTCSAPHCCRQLALVSLWEAIEILEDVADQSLGPVLEVIGEQARELWGRMLPDPTAAVRSTGEAGLARWWWRQQRPCPLLVQDRCAVYAVRPTVCRSALALEDPERCAAAFTGAARFVSATVPFSQSLAADRAFLLWLAGEDWGQWLPLPLPVAVTLAADVIDRGLAALVDWKEGRWNPPDFDPALGPPAEDASGETPGLLTPPAPPQ